MLRMDRAEWFVRRVLAACAIVLLIGNALDGDWLRALLWLVLAGVLLHKSSGPGRRELDRRERERQAAARWTPAKAAEVLDRHYPGDTVAAVKALRAVDPDLSLTDAVQLVKQRPPV